MSEQETIRGWYDRTHNRFCFVDEATETIVTLIKTRFCLRIESMKPGLFPFVVNQPKMQWVKLLRLEDLLFHDKRGATFGEVIERCYKLV